MNLYTNYSNEILSSIEKSNLIFISAQPDETYFHWQVEIYLYQFAKHGIIDRCYALFGYKGQEPSKYALELSKRYPNIKFYKDTRKMPNAYSPSIRPNILAQFFKEYPDLGKNVFYHDSDIFLVKMPRFDQMLNDDIAYLSDTISYIGYNYIKICSERYKSTYPQLKNNDIFFGMCEIIGIDPKLVEQNENNSGGAQYLLKDIDYTFWEECETKCLELYNYFVEYDKKYRIGHGIQKWTADMWVLLWLYWKKGKKTLIHSELHFSWAIGTANEYNTRNIFHLAGVTSNNSNNKFHKGLYVRKNIFDEYKINPNIFNHIDRNNATYEYVKVIKEYVSNNNNVKVIKDTSYNKIIQFTMNTSMIYNGIYNIDKSKKCCDNYIWRSQNKTFIIFWTGSIWVLTYSKYENEIGPKCGGIISNNSDNPCLEWNSTEEIKIDSIIKE